MDPVRILATDASSAEDVKWGDNPWRGGWPNPAGLNFNFYRLLELDDHRPIAKVGLQASEKRIAVIGAGIAGVTAARELVRCGFKNVHLFEATNRIGGRLFSLPVDSKRLSGTPTTYELGAMRVPFFRMPGSRNSLTDYYVKRFGLKDETFPNPGEDDILAAVYMNEGYGPNPEGRTTRKPLIFMPGDTGKTRGYKKLPDDALIQSVDGKWQDFKQRARRIFEQEYLRQTHGAAPGREADHRWSHWQLFWRKVERAYSKVDFRELATRPGTINPETPWDFGGMGMTTSEAEVFATIGAGDGGWGPFYDVSALWVLRTLMFGYTENLRLIVGKLPMGESKTTSSFRDLFNTIRKDHEGELPIRPDTVGCAFEHPRFLGVQSLAECMIFEPHEDGSSFYELAREHCDDPSEKNFPKNRVGAGLYMNTQISKIERVPRANQRFKLTFDVYEYEVGESKDEWRRKKIAEDQDASYDCVIMTVPSWTVQPLIGIELGEEILPKSIAKTLSTSHWIASRKVFFPLKRRFWDDRDNRIPQVWVTDNLLQGVYAYSAGQGDNGVILISYTWEDDALKLLSQDKAALMSSCIRQLRLMFQHFAIKNPETKDILRPEDIIRTGSDGEIDYASGWVYEWLTQPTYRGCAKLYRAATYGANYDVARYNQERPIERGLLFAGSSYSLDDGWLEPAMRHAIDAVLHILHEQDGTRFKQPFSWDDYTNYPPWGKLPDPEIRE